MNFFYLFFIFTKCWLASGQINFDPGDAVYLTKYIETNRIKEGQRKALVNITGSNIKSYAGYFTVGANHIFVWYVPAEQDSKNAPVLLWLPGGPGQSLFYNLLKGTGPWSITDKCEFVERNTSSHKTHHTIYVDNPVCTGFSYTGNCTSGLATNQTEIMNTLLPVIQQFLTLFPNLRQKQFFIQGESYGGKYAVKFAEAVHESNFNCKQPKINLVGVAIGSGLVDPINLSNFTTLPAQISLVDANGAQKMLAIQNEGYRLIQAGQYTAAFSQSVALFNAFFTLSNYNQYFNFAKDGIEDPSNIQTCLDHVTPFITRYGVIVRVYQPIKS